MSEDRKQLILEEFDTQRKILKKLEEKVKGLLQELLDTHKIMVHSIDSRIKTREKLSEKVDRKQNKYAGLQEITDVVGFRIITLFSDTVDQVAEIIEHEFQVDWENSIDKRKSLEPDRFGYLSLHYVAALSSDRLQLTENRPYKNFYFEIQIRSVLQHAWAEMEHDFGYKSMVSVPEHLRRGFSRLAGMLELADDEFKRIRDELMRYRQDLEGSLAEGNLADEKLEQFLIDRESIVTFLKKEPLIQEIIAEIVSAIFREKNTNFIEDIYTTEEDILRLKIVGFRTINDIKSDLEKYRDKIVNFAVRFLVEKQVRYIPVNITISTKIILTYLCYIKLALTQETQEMIESLKQFNLNNMSHEGQFIELAQKIQQAYEEA